MNSRNTILIIGSSNNHSQAALPTDKRLTASRKKSAFHTESVMATGDIRRL
jgi:hypothetical protein